MSEQQLVSYIKQLGADLELEEKLDADKSGFYTVEFSKTLHISIKALASGYYYSSNLGAPPEKSSEEFFKLAMHANLFGLGTGGSVIGLNSEGKMLTFTLNSPYQLSYDQFREQIEDFVNWVDMWQKKSEDARTLVS